MKPQNLLAVDLPQFIRRLAARHGYVILPISEIERMEEDAASYYRLMKREFFDDKVTGYLNGLGDYSSKTAIQLRGKYIPSITNH